MIRTQPNISRTSNRTDESKPRHGFTLFEVLLASGLSVLLLFAVYGALDLHWRYSTAGQDEVERSQLARALFGKMSHDIRAVVFHLPDPAKSEDDDELSNDQSDDSQQVIRVAGTAESHTESGIGIIVDSGTLLLHADTPISMLDETTPTHRDTPWAQAGGLQLIAWFTDELNPRKLKRMLSGESTGPASRSRGSQQVGGIIRFEHDWRQLQLDSGGRSLDSLVDHQQFLAAEIKHLSFRYFDGVEWHDRWDSVALEALPRAIEIVLGFREPQHSVRSTRRRAANEDLLRFVVAVPLSPPYATQIKTRDHAGGTTGNLSRSTRASATSPSTRFGSTSTRFGSTSSRFGSTSNRFGSTKP